LSEKPKHDAPPGSEVPPQQSGTDLHSPLSYRDEMERLRDRAIAKLLVSPNEKAPSTTRAKKVRLFSTRSRKNTTQFYSEVLAKLIPHMISEGWLLSDLCDLPGMPSPLEINEWRKQHEDFKADMDTAYKARAEVMHDRALKVADASKFASAKSDSIKCEVLKWSAERSDPDRFSSKREATTNNYAFFFQSSFGPENKEPRKVIIETRDPSLVFRESEEKKGEEGSDGGEQE